MSLSHGSPLALLGRDDPVLFRRLAVALDHHHGRIELAATHDSAPLQLPVLGALCFSLEAGAVARGRDLVGGIRVPIAIARGRAEAPVLEDQRIGVTRGLAALQ